VRTSRRFKAQANQFIDMNTLGADKIAGQFLEWKWKQGSTQDGKLVGFPIDIGPTALFYARISSPRPGCRRPRTRWASRRCPACTA